MTLSIDVISYNHGLDDGISERDNGLETHLDQNVSHVLETALGPISPLVPTPVVEQVVIYLSVVYQDVLGKLGRVIVEKVAQRFDDLGDNGSEVGIIFWQFLRERYEGIKRPGLSSREKNSEITESKCVYLEGRDMELADATRRECLGLL